MNACQHQVTLEKARGRCSKCGLEIKNAQMKNILVADRQRQYKAGYAKGLEDGRAQLAEPIDIPPEPSAEVKEDPPCQSAEDASSTSSS